MQRLITLFLFALLCSYTALQANTEIDFSKYIHSHPSGVNHVGYIYIGDHETAISESTWLYVRQALNYYKQNKPIFIILELDTPGGEVFAAQKISDALKEMDTQHNIPVVAYINNWAISAGAMLAYSCRYIVTVKDGSMGAAEPVIPNLEGKLEAASEKINSALRADFAGRARFFDRNPYVAQAMVDKDMIVVRRHGEIIQLDSESQIKHEGPDADQIISSKGKLLTLDADQMLATGVANAILSPLKLEPITAEEKGSGVWPASKMLLFHQPFFQSIPNAEVQAYELDWKTRFFMFLALPAVSSLLLTGLMVGAYVELTNPGLSLPGSIAAICLFLIVLSTFSLEIANWLELILFLTGLVLVLVELFILPTFGLLGFVGIMLLLGGLAGMLIPGLSSVHFDFNTQTLNAAGEFALNRLAWFSGALIISFIAIIALARVLPRFRGWQKLVLSGHEQDASEGYIAGENPSHLPKPGTKGIALTTLRPAGKVLIEGQIYEALSNRGYIDAQQPIYIMRLEGNVIIVDISL